MQQQATDVSRSRAEGRGSGPSPRLRRGRGALAAAAVALVVVAVATVLLTQGGGGSAGRYGTLPRWLPQPKAPTDHLVTASAAHPKLATEGDTVRVVLDSGQADVTVVGPRVPEEGKFPVPATSPCTFVVTLTRVRGAVPLRVRDFNILAENSQLFRPRVSMLHGGAVPAALRAGQTISLELRATLPTGGGQVRWTPQGAKPLSSWDFDVEID